MALIAGVVRKARAHHVPATGMLGEPWTVGRTALWAAILLIVCLLMAFV
jgi:hypothetical protein